MSRVNPLGMKAHRHCEWEKAKELPMSNSMSLAKTVRFSALGALLLAAHCAPIVAAEPSKASDAWNGVIGKRVIAYTKEFAERFKLPSKDVQPALSGGLEAIEIGFESRLGTDIPQCFMSLYLDRAVEIADDLGMESSANLLDQNRHFFLRPRPDGQDPRALMSKSDAESLLRRQARYFIQLRFATRDFVEGKSGAEGSAPIKEQVRNLLPSINYIRTQACIPARMIERGKGVDVGIRRKGAPNLALQGGPLGANNFVHISLPTPVLMETLPSLIVFEKRRQEVVEAANRNRTWPSHPYTK